MTAAGGTDTVPSVEVQLLGPVVVRVDGSPVPVKGAKERALLSVLALRAGSVVSTTELVDYLWDSPPPPSSLQGLRNCVTHLRRVLPPGVVVTMPGGYLADLKPDAVDALRFERAVAAARRVADDASAAAILEEALGWWTGPPLPDLAGSNRGDAEATRLSELRAAALEDLYEAQLAQGRHVALVAELERAVAEEPLRERRWAQLMLALYRCDRQADALRAYQRLRRLLSDELGLEPSTDIQSLETAIVAQDASLNLRAGAAARSIDAEQTTRNHNIPDVLSSFVGRKEEMPWIEADLGTFRLVTIVGPGGCGKTRLALEIAGRLVDSGKHAWLIDLSPLRDQADVPAAIAQVLGVHEAPPRSLIESIERSIRDKQLTMVVDNCEHLIEEASKVIESLLQGCPNLRVLATSREPLSIAGERVDRIRPLSVPDSNASMLLDDLLQSDAVRLFVDRARAISPEFDLNELTGPHVATVCTRLDGIPLAIELAAAQCKSMSVSEIADGLSDRFALLTAGSRTAPARHRTLEAAIAWSYDLLDHAQQQALAALSVFDGAFTLQAAVAISSSRSVPDDGASSVSSLAECSLLQVEVGRPTRFRLLESVREFAAMRLWAGNAEAVHAVYDRHTNFYLHRYSGRGHEEVTSTASEELGLAETFPHDRADVLTAARRVISRGNLDESDVEFIITAGDGLNSFGEYSLQLELLRGALEASDPDISQLGFARLWHQVALIQTALGKLSEARTLLERAISLLDWEIDPFEYINVLCDLGDIMLQSGDVAGITRVFSLVDQAMERGGPEGVTAQIHPRQSAVPFFRAYFAGASDPDQARDDIKRSLEFHESHGLSTYLDYYLLGSLEAERGNVDDGCRIMYDILDQARALGPSSLQRFLLDLAAFEAVRGHGEKAMDLALEAALIISNTETTGLYANGALKLALALEACGESVGSATAHGAAVNLLTEEVFYPFDERLRLESRTRLESDLGRESFEAAIGVGDLLDFESLADLVRSARDV